MFKVLLVSTLLGFGVAQTPLKWLGADPATLKICEGDCDVNSHCPGASSCVQRENGAPDTIEGCTTGDETDSARAGTDYCDGVVQTELPVTKCQSGVADLVGTSKALTAQVCNLFGGVCYINQVQLASSTCATGALKINHGSCALFPIMDYTDANTQQVGDLDCTVVCSGATCKLSGACVSVQCSTGEATFVGPANTAVNSWGVRTTAGITDTNAETVFTVNTFAEIKAGMNTFFLSRTGNYVGTYQTGPKETGTTERFRYTSGLLPWIAGVNYGPTVCPSPTTLMSAATSATKEDLRMCGSNSGKWVYYAGVNLLMDKTMYAAASGNSAVGTNTLATTLGFNLGAAPFLHGVTGFQSGNAMDDQRKVYLYEAATKTGEPFLNSDTITPATSEGMTKLEPDDVAGTWRTYGVVFYCTDYARTDLTKCATSNRAMFYVADPNPAPAFGASAGNIGAGGKNMDASGSVAYSSIGVATIMAMVSAMQV